MSKSVYIYKCKQEAQKMSVGNKSSWHEPSCATVTHGPLNVTGCGTAHVVTVMFNETSGVGWSFASALT